MNALDVVPLFFLLFYSVATVASFLRHRVELSSRNVFLAQGNKSGSSSALVLVCRSGTSEVPTLGLSVLVLAVHPLQTKTLDTQDMNNSREARLDFGYRLGACAYMRVKGEKYTTFLLRDVRKGRDCRLKSSDTS